MPSRFNSALLAVAADFVGQFAPWQSIEVAPMPGGVSVAACDRGAVAMIGYDPKGSTDDILRILPTADLIKAARGIKTAPRDVYIEGSTAIVTTYRKEHNTSIEVPITYSSVETPSLRPVIDAAIKRWGTSPASSGTSGRYDASFLLNAFKAVCTTDSLVMCGFDGGPLRLQREDCEIVILICPQEALPIPPVPDWLYRFASSPSA